MQMDKIEFILIRIPGWKMTACFADIILPSNTKYEEEDIAADHWPVQYNCVYLEDKCIEPIGESKTDWVIVGEIAKPVWSV
jgi:trimethylamine-N-oxide reductase (cytochrome c)